MLLSAASAVLTALGYTDMARNPPSNGLLGKQLSLPIKAGSMLDLHRVGGRIKFVTAV